MKRLFLFILFIFIGGYFGAGYFNGPALAVTPNEVLLKDKKLQHAFKTIVQHEEKVTRAPASPEVEVSGEADEVTREPEQVHDEVEYDLSGDTFESLTAQVEDLELKAKFYKSRNETEKAEAAEKQIEFLKVKIKYLPESE